MTAPSNPLPDPATPGRPAARTRPGLPPPSSLRERRPDSSDRAKMSSDRTVRSASIPGRSVPRRSSSNAAVAPPSVYARSVSSRVIRSCGIQPSGFAPSIVRRVTAASIPRIGSMGATVQSEPNARGLRRPGASGTRRCAGYARARSASRPSGRRRPHGRAAWRRSRPARRSGGSPSARGAGRARSGIGGLGARSPPPLAVDVEEPVVGAVADGVDDHLEPGRVRALDLGAELDRVGDHEARRYSGASA